MLWEEYVFLSNLQYVLINDALCALVILSYFSLKAILLSISSCPLNIFKKRVFGLLLIFFSLMLSIHILIGLFHNRNVSVQESA